MEKSDGKVRYPASAPVRKRKLSASRRRNPLRKMSVLEFAIDHMAESLYLIDSDARFIHVNQRACRLLGYSSLGYLKRFPIDVLKIDRSFVGDVTLNRDSAELTKAIISMARSLRLEIVAEGVETEAQERFLLEHGCRIAQGFRFGKPAPQNEFEERFVPALCTGTNG